MKIGSKGQAPELRRKNTRNGSSSGINGHVSTSAPTSTQLNSHDMNTSPMYKLSASRFCQKVYIPLDEHPGFNFVGLIIGPRGRHQKMLEGTCGAKIAVRGQGGTFHASPRRDGRPDASHDDLHVLVQGESEEIVERGVELVCKVLRPPDGKTWKPGRQGSVSTVLQDLARASHDSEPRRMVRKSRLKKDFFAYYPHFQVAVGGTPHSLSLPLCCISSLKPKPTAMKITSYIVLSVEMTAKTRRATQ